MGIDYSKPPKMVYGIFSTTLDRAAEKKPLHPGTARATTAAGILLTAGALVFGGVKTIEHYDHTATVSTHRKDNQALQGTLVKGQNKFMSAKPAVRSGVSYLATEGAKLYYEPKQDGDVYRKVPAGKNLFAFLGQKVVVDNHVWIGVADGSVSTARDRVYNTYWLNVTDDEKHGTVHVLLPVGQKTTLPDAPIAFQENGQVIDTHIAGQPVDAIAGTSLWENNTAADLIVGGLHIYLNPPK